MSGPTRFLSLACVLVLAGAPPLAADQAEVAAGLSRDTSPWTGEQVIIDLDLKTDALSFANIHFDLPEITGGFLMRPDTTTLKLTERRGDGTWQVLRYPLTLFPQVGGELTVPAIAVRFETNQGYGSEPESHALETAAFTVTVRRPPGVADGALVVTSDRLDIDPEWTTPQDPVQAGDAWTLTVRRSVDDVSAMLLPPLPVYESDGLRAYPAAPVVRDRSNRGQLVGERTDAITWMIEQPGSYRIPDIRFQWWNPGDERLQDLVVPGVSFDAAPAPGQASSGVTPATPQAGRASPWPWLAGFTVLALLGLIAWRSRQGLARWGRRILPPPRVLLPDINPGPRR